MEQLIPLLVGVLSSGLVELAKRVQFLPIWAGQTARLRVLLGVLVVGGNVVNALLNGTLQDLAASEQVNVVLESAVSWAVGHFTYALGIKKLNS